MKTNSADLHEALYSIISALVENTAYENIPKPVTYPYAVFSTRILGHYYGQYRYQVDVDVASRDIATVETLADSIMEHLDHRTYDTTTIFFHVYHSSRYTVVEEDKGIERRHLTFELYFYSRSEENV